MHHRILQHRFTDSKANVITLAVVHFVFAVLLLFPGKIAVFSWGRPQLCLLIAGIFLGLYRYYDWKNHAVNLAISGVYLLSLVYEWTSFGFPAPPMAIPTSGTPSKGVMLDLFLFSLPTVYAVLRVGMVGLLVSVAVAAKRLPKPELLTT